MAERLNSTAAELAGASWAPAGETILQIDTTAPAAKVTVQARVNAAAPWATVGTIASWPSEQDRFIRLPRFPLLRLVLAGNTAGSSVKVWDNE